MTEQHLRTLEREATAYHEAGHAVMALSLGRPVHRVSIVARQNWLGLCEFRKGVQRPSDDWLETELLIALAGMVAEAIHTGRPDELGAARDLRHARKLMLARTTERSLPRYEQRMVNKADCHLRDDATWRAVEAIAQALLDSATLSGRAAMHLYTAAQRG